MATPKINYCMGCERVSATLFCDRCAPDLAKPARFLGGADRDTPGRLMSGRKQGGTGIELPLTGDDVIKKVP